MLHRSRPLTARRHGAGDEGFSLLELVLTITLVATLTAIAVGVTPNIVKWAKGDSGAMELDAFLKRHRETAIARRRDIEIRFIEPNQVESAERSVPDPENGVNEITTTVLERLTFEGRIQYWKPDGAPDTPDGFGNEAVIDLGGTEPVMFSSEGAFLDSDGDPVNATLFVGVKGDPQTATAVTILGTTASIRRWHWNGTGWSR